MLKEKVRDLQAMSAETKLRYFKVLFSMALIDGELNQLEAMELYRLMGKIKILQKERLDLLNNMDAFSENIIDICKTLLEGLNDQEKNILRFSLMKDLIIIMGADYYQSPAEIELFSKIRTFFQITEEQLYYFQEEYREDRSFFDEASEKSVTVNRLEERILTAAALGIPIGALYIKKCRDKNDYFFFYRGKKELSAIDLLKALTIGVVTYKGLKWLLKMKTNKKETLKQCLYKECLKIQDRAIRYLVKDRRYFQEKLLNLEKENEETVSIESKVVLLDKVDATFKNTKLYLL
ncbi:hypothetical protein SAMN05446037_1003308 [Anaerovirgula multivorans]|uniref:Tellurite resistance protein TerB n=1 Tax=Anaerovirgula multivorans TaxID=312168 RepID=A0A239BI53_9FIRM|nr:hypothetical protein [Anaerovirgula multivorans]SNS07795.1 hypothetical protein SAMN05446037_1003308 [Anaerovirgula multivorans]